MSIRTPATSDSEGYAAGVSDFEFMSAVVAHRDLGRKYRSWCIRHPKGHLSSAWIAVWWEECREASQSPWSTLAAVFVAFGIMFSVEMLSGPPGKSSAGTADAPVESARASASSGSPQPDRDRRRLAFPSANASNTKDGSSAITEAVFRNQAAGYFCDGRDVESWFGAPTTEPTSP